MAASGSPANVCSMNWSPQETYNFLCIIRDENMLHLLDGKRVANTHLYTTVAEKFNVYGHNRTAIQLRNKWKSLKSLYKKNKAALKRSGGAGTTTPWFDVLDELLGGRPNAMAHDNGVDSLRVDMDTETDLMVAAVAPEDVDVMYDEASSAAHADPRPGSSDSGSSEGGFTGRRKSSRDSSLCDTLRAIAQQDREWKTEMLEKAAARDEEMMRMNMAFTENIVKQFGQVIAAFTAPGQHVPESATKD